ncbi:unnamed protein product [Strongylus vulgaris]|uniref:Uncharacterized protein n=1 Tax=Strongylus vulgaris TaxID=40348 RepID=A0A3P7LPE0_STRVU|nr:unnamed protein product [Strongylus vulgaris]
MCVSLLQANPTFLNECLNRITYVCPEPLVAYGWPRTAGSPMQAIAGGRLTCTTANPFWRTPGLVGMRLITCMSRPQTSKLEFTCPAGTKRYIYEAVGQGYVPASDTNPITCNDNGPGSSWNTQLDPPFEDAYVQYVSCFSET